MKIAPMLAATCENLSSLKLPGLLSPKLDGIRCLLHPVHGPVTRKLEPIPNTYIRTQLNKLHRKDLLPDGELIVGKPNDPTTWNKAQSGIMSADGRPDFTFFVFDWIDTTLPYHQRYKKAKALVRIWKSDFAWLKLLEHTRVTSVKEIKNLEQSYVDDGYEGAMFRSLDGPYKCGRATAREGYLFKIKRFVDTEGVIVGFKEKMHNANKAEVDNLGYTKRSSHKANKIPMGTLGKLVIKATFPSDELVPTPKLVYVGTGFDAATGKHIWNNQKKYLGKIAKFKYYGLTAYGVPKFAVYLGIRKD